MNRKALSVGGLIAAVVLAGFSIGCEWKGGGGVDQAAAQRGKTWRPEPVKMRVYPSSRIVKENGQTILEARLELLDEMGDSAKGAGNFHLELQATDKSGSSPPQQVDTWDVTVAGLDHQKRYYDSVTRAYFFRLKLDVPLPANRKPVVKASLSTPEGKRVSAEASITYAG